MNGHGINAHRLADGRIGITCWIPAAHGETAMRQVALTTKDALVLIEDLSRMVREDVP